MLGIVNKSIGARLAIGFGSILAAMLGMILFALVDMAGIEHRLDQIVESNVRKTELVSTLSESVHIVSRVVRTVILLDDEADIEREKAKIDAARTAYDEAEKALDAMPGSERGLAIRAKIKAAKAASRPLASRVLELALAHRDAEAMALLKGELIPADQAWQNALDENIALQQESNEQDHAAAAQAYERTRTTMLATGGIVLLLGIAFSVFTTRSITRPLLAARDTMVRMREDGDLTRRATGEGECEIGQILRAFNGLIERFQSIVGQVQSNAEQVSSAATELSATSAQVAEAATRQSEAAAATAAGVEQMAVSVASVADSAEDVRKISNDSLERTEKGNRGLADMGTRFNALEADVEAIATAVQQFVESTDAITTMTQQVSAIADQTNLLALNAAIEAARAGEHGRGFAVVADEVRKLAEQSRRHASEIDAVTQKLGQQSEQVGVTIERGLESLRGSRSVMDSVGSALGEVGHTVAAANRGVDEITASVREQKTVTSDIARNMEQIAQMSESSSAAVMESAEAAHHLERLAANLQSAVAGLKS